MAFFWIIPFLVIHGQQNNGPLRVITYNIWNGFDWGKDTLRHHKFIDWAAFQKPDIFALQELCGYTQARLEQDARRWGHEYALILKEDGYPVGLTSRWPIKLISKYREGMWHGMLHVQTGGIDVFVVHLSPADWQFRNREAHLITRQLDTLTNDRYLVVGDFNAHSPMDADLDLDRKSLLARYKTGDAKNEKYQNLRHGYWDYTTLSTFLSQGLIDVSMPFIAPSERFSFPTPALTNIWQTVSEIKRHRERIDFILAGPALAGQCVYSRILNGPETAELSDHYPVVADFILRLQKE
ncbi:MAG: endonuclease/exonuclease/phosphatase family protein [Saprospiraceae bacterium]|nr:endonuclease/exonuclease/phosphatase family protein [Lewinella sp.]